MVMINRKHDNKTEDWSAFMLRGAAKQLKATSGAKRRHMAS